MQSILPYAWINTYNTKGGTEPQGKEKTEEEREGGNTYKYYGVASGLHTKSAGAAKLPYQGTYKAPLNDYIINACTVQCTSNPHKINRKHKQI